MMIQNQLRADEKFMSHGYLCSAGVLTIGYGRNIDKEDGGPGITQQEANILLRNDLAEVEQDVRRIFPNWNEIDQVRKNALMNMRFQLGPSRFRGFRRMIAAVKHGAWTQACGEALDSKWAFQTPSRARRVANELLDGVSL